MCLQRGLSCCRYLKLNAAFYLLSDWWRRESNRWRFRQHFIWHLWNNRLFLKIIHWCQVICDVIATKVQPKFGENANRTDDITLRVIGQCCLGGLFQTANWHPKQKYALFNSISIFNIFIDLLYLYAPGLLRLLPNHWRM